MQTGESEGLTRIWAGATLDGFSFMAKDQAEAAGQRWIEARDLLGESPHGDAAAAVAQSNTAVGNILLHRSADARAAFIASDECWRAVAEMIETLELPIATTSSSFHFRLAARDTKSFTRLRRKRYAQLCQAGREIARFNSHQADLNHRAGVLAARSQELRICLTQAFGASCVEVALLSEVDEDSGIARASIYEAKSRAFNRIVEAARTPLDFWTRLECAVRLAALLIPLRAGGSFSQLVHRS